jgi:hypothetical protein
LKIVSGEKNVLDTYFYELKHVKYQKQANPKNPFLQDIKIEDPMNKTMVTTVCFFDIFPGIN